MERQRKIRFDTYTDDTHEKAHAVLDELALMLNRAIVINALVGHKVSDEKRRLQHRIVGSHIASSVNTLASILTLTEKLSLQVREAVALSRAFYESCLLGSFCALDNGERANRAELYWIYKTFRTQTVHANLGPFTAKVSKSNRLNRSHPKVKEALELFGGSNGIRPCFTQKREDIIEIVAEADALAGIQFRGVEAMIYDLSSEIIHGSYYSFQTFQPTDPSPEKDLMNKFEMVFFSICLSASALSKSIHSKMLSIEHFKDIDGLTTGALEEYAKGFST